MDLDMHDPETIQPAATPISSTPEEERMTTSASQSAPIARAVGASGATAVERHSAEVLKVSTQPLRGDVVIHNKLADCTALLAMDHSSFFPISFGR